MSTASSGLSALGQIAFTVSDVERATKFFRDPDGNIFELMSEKR
jgi:hypothetical protein